MKERIYLKKLWKLYEFSYLTVDIENETDDSNYMVD